ncbi:MAG: FAD dependent oxidoreductase [uncultured Sulfurovum sp.]|uniref:FAD dependent oxidoreductase n=1 Tax=uncultured Sulfurovum sp. TaxID=269237 RepID=A0A6S6T3T5_9BACT|nr:MAG: FAD dependent oxidoreductase [uncultured Sulfurovum sp.]
MKNYDVIIIGAGITGCSSAYFLKEKGLNVLVVDRNGIAKSGGSAAAGAFVSPKIGKGSALQALTNEAFEFSKDFYLNNFPKYFKQTGVIRIPKDDEDAKLFFEYEKYDSSNRIWLKEEELKSIGIKKSKDSFLFDEAGVCDAPEMCKAFLEGIDYVQYDVESLNYEDSLWNVGKYESTKIILATGYENKFFDMRYMGIKGTWGRRGDYTTNLNLNVSLHKKISVSANIKGIIKVGATHEKETQACIVSGKNPLKDLFTVASEMVNTSDFKLKKIFSGMRAGSKDYFPLVGSVINVSEMLKSNPKLVRGAKLTEKPIRMKNLYVCNGVGGRGFVFAPFIGKMLADNIVDGKEIDARVDPDRLFLKWCRKSPDLER